MKADPDAAFVRKITNREEADPPHPLEIIVTFECGHRYKAHGFLASEYKKENEAVCEHCRWEAKHEDA